MRKDKLFPDSCLAKHAATNGAIATGRAGRMARPGMVSALQGMAMMMTLMRQKGRSLRLVSKVAKTAHPKRHRCAEYAV